MVRLPVPGSDDNVWGNVLNDYLSVEHAGDGTLKNVARPADLAAKAAVLTATTIKTSAYTANPNELVRCNASGGAFTVTLPAATTAGQVVLVKKLDSSANAITIQRAGSDVINQSSSSLSISLRDEALSLTSTGTGTWIESAGQKALDTLDARYLKRGELSYNIKDFGAKGDGVTDDTAALRAALVAMHASPGMSLTFPPGLYQLTPTSSLDFTLLQEARFLGNSGRVGWTTQGIGGNPITALVFDAGSMATGKLMDFQGSQGCIWDGISIRVTNAIGFNGTVMSFDPVVQADVFGNRLQNFHIEVLGYGGTPVLLSLADCIETSCDNVAFGHAAQNGTQVRMVNPASAGGSHWSNANSFRSCSFLDGRAVSVLNPAQQTTFLDCTFEYDWSRGNTTAPVQVDSAGASGVGGISFTGCGFWDVSSSTGNWIKTTIATYAWSFHGCTFEGAGNDAIFSFASHDGLAIIGCDFATWATGGTANIFDPTKTVTNALAGWLGNHVHQNSVDNHASRLT